jgi:aldehyde dehydrogenase (NAD+)
MIDGQAGSTATLLIDGSLREARAGATYASVNPSTELRLPECPDAGVEDAQLAVSAARRAFDESPWAQDHALRHRCLVQLGDALLRHADSFKNLLVDEIGIPVSNLDVRWTNPLRYIDFCATAVEPGNGWHSLINPSADEVSGGRLMRPWARGVVASIPAYNSPIQMFISKVAPAIATGCTTVVKMPPQVPNVGALLATVLAAETDLPPGTVNVLTSSGPTVGETIVSDTRVDMVSFTGSHAVGRKVLAGSATSVKKVVLELGGKSAHVVLDDVDDLEGVTAAAVARCSRHAGQGCAVPSRLLVPRARLDEAAAAAADAARRLRWGDPWETSTEMGPLISAEHRRRVLGFIDRAIDAGADLIAGGAAPPHAGYFVAPTVFAGVDRDAEIATEEIFGPVLVIIPHQGDDDAVCIANRSRYGLSAKVSSGSVERGLSVARRIRVGMVSVNGVDPVSPDTPFGGLKQSGVGKEMGHAGIEEFLEYSVVAY